MMRLTTLTQSEEVDLYVGKCTFLSDTFLATKNRLTLSFYDVLAEQFLAWRLVPNPYPI